ncbi:MAG TPA: hypothetical protein VL993_14165 [Stellaceae bacterium]|nr:hypothetical protein [Stellaceae bacterium]
MNIAPDDVNSPFKFYWVWGRPTADAAERDAMDVCNRSLPRDHTRPRSCKLVATNNTLHYRREDLGVSAFTPGS